MSLRAQVLDALGAVIDPELDEPITTLGFISSCDVSAAGDVTVHLRLPTPQCAPNFAFLMASDARSAARGVAGVGEVRVVLDDHYTGAEINEAVARDAGFDGAFPGETEGDLTALRTLFRRKALVGRQARVCEALVADHDDAAICAMRVDELPASPDAERCLQLRRELGLPNGGDAPALVAGDGSAIEPAQLRMWLRRARLMTLGLESNAAICRSLLAVRYPDRPQEVTS
jgi:metal-sulfur cluster biosynthetic enzyme